MGYYEQKRNKEELIDVEFEKDGNDGMGLAEDVLFVLSSIAPVAINTL